MSEPLDLGQFKGSTPGPWRADTEQGCIMALSPMGFWYVLFANMQGGQADHAEDEANARLLAAAPALRDEVERLRGLLAEVRAYVVLASAQFPAAARDMLDAINAALPKGGEGK